MAEGRRRSGVWVWLLAIVAVLGLLWVGYWYAAQYAATTALARIAAGPVYGAKVTCTGGSVGGFPLRLDVRCDRATVTEAIRRIDAALGGFAATAPLYWPGYVEADLVSPFVVNAPTLGVALTTTWSSGTANVAAGIGGLKGLGASFASLAATNTGTLSPLPISGLSADSANASVAPEGGGAFAIDVAARKLTLTRADASTLPEIDGEARLTLQEVGKSLGTDPAGVLLDWARRGGTARIDRLRIAGVGAVITSEGTLRLSEDGRLNGQILLRWNDIARLADFIEAILPGTREKADVPLQGLNAVSTEVHTPDGKLRQTTLTFTDGVIWLAIFPLPIDPIPPIRF